MRRSIPARAVAVCALAVAAGCGSRPGARRQRKPERRDSTAG
ncbi:MAG TPA: hypothetical protein PK696_05085 [bacterium]|nr:hypothetical protein [bacterium]HQM51985.1 hypothetical protein [bacterium]